jgi:hypothetical protein
VQGLTFSSSSYGTYHFDSRVFPWRFWTQMRLFSDFISHVKNYNYLYEYKPDHGTSRRMTNLEAAVYFARTCQTNASYFDGFGIIIGRSGTATTNSKIYGTKCIGYTQTQSRHDILTRSETIYIRLSTKIKSKPIP